MTDYDLDRFIAAQRGYYDQALEEIRAGAKRSHWMWFVFPQIAGLGRSAMAMRYAIRDLGEARAYLAHPVLGPRLAACTDAILGWAGRRDAVRIFGVVDAMKLRSSMTLFEAAAIDAGETDAAASAVRYATALDAFFGGERDAETLRRIG